MDLSPYFLSIAILQNKVNGRNIKYLHSNVECISLKEKSFDMITIQFLFHEMPDSNINNVVKEAYRLLTSGGTICILDLNQEMLKDELSKNHLNYGHLKLQSHINSYYKSDIKQILLNNNFKCIHEK